MSAELSLLLEKGRPGFIRVQSQPDGFPGQQLEMRLGTPKQVVV